MYSTIKSVQMLVALLKKFNIRDIVLSPGGSDIPIIHSIEKDPFFQCYSVVDERSAAYYAMGVSQAKNRPAACVCTSGTAVCNYLPGITEAYYQNVPVVAVTADKSPYFQGQLETQKIDQAHILSGVVKKAVDLPLIHTKEDAWLCERLINEALLEMDHHGKGPVHINIPIIGQEGVYDCEALPDVRVIHRICAAEPEDAWKEYALMLQDKKIMVVVGQNISFSSEDIEMLNTFYDRYNCIFAVEHLSNLECKGAVYTYPLTEMCDLSQNSGLKPDIVISIGNNLAAYGLKPYLRMQYQSVDNWLVSEEGRVRDAYKCLKYIFECPVSWFFKRILSSGKEGILSEHAYYDAWMESLAQIELPEFGFTNFYVGRKLAEIIPPDSLLHLAILNSTRVMQFFEYSARGKIKTFSNVGALGIDGCFSTFAGQAAAAKGQAYLLIGDLSFFYDMNAAGLRSIGKNVRVILLNNGGAAEFHFFLGKEKIPEINQYICAEHEKKAEGWIRSLGYEYYSASSKEEFDRIAEILPQESDKPVFVEVFTDMEEEGVQTRMFYTENGEKNKPKENILKAALRSCFSQQQLRKIDGIRQALRGEPLE